MSTDTQGARAQAYRIVESFRARLQTNPNAAVPHSYQLIDDIASAILGAATDANATDTYGEQGLEYKNVGHHMELPPL